MSGSITIPPAELTKFRRTLEDYAKVNKRTFQEIVNAKALDWAHKSLRATEKANADFIAYQLGQIGRKDDRISKKTGKLIKGARIFKTDTSSFAHRIVNARLRDAGKPMIWGAELDRAAKKMVAARIRSAAFLRSGWLAAIKVLARVVKDPSVRSQARELGRERILGRDKGAAWPATESLQPVAMILNSSTKDSPTGAARIEAGLRRGLAVVEADMRGYIEKHMQPAIDKLNR